MKLLSKRVAQESDFCPPDARIRHDGWRLYWKLLRLAGGITSVRIGRRSTRVRAAARAAPRQRILLAAVEVPGREAALASLIAAIEASGHHHVDVAVARMAPVGKFDNINSALAGMSLEGYDWLMIVDDDINIPPDFLDLLIYLSTVHDLKLVQPAHRFRSYATYKVTERQWASLVRRTSFVETGPVTLMQRDTFGVLLPFQSLRWAWGLDIYWSDVARTSDWKMGVVDATPIEHLRPVGESYDWQQARDEAHRFLTAANVSLSPAGMFDVGIRIG